MTDTESTDDGFADFDTLLKKPRRTVVFSVSLPTDDGGKRNVKMRFRAMRPSAYDELMASHEPTAKGKEDGQIWHPDSFPPALIAACSDQPKLSLEQAQELWTNPDWSNGERQDLFVNALGVNNRGLDVPFNSGG